VTDFKQKDKGRDKNAFIEGCYKNHCCRVFFVLNPIECGEHGFVTHFHQKVKCCDKTDFIKDPSRTTGPDNSFLILLVSYVQEPLYLDIK
jgi:hypothetical protein